MRSSCVFPPLGEGFQVTRPVSVALGDGHPISSVSPMGRADARSRGNERPEGVRVVFHVNLYKVEPSESALVRNLLAKNDERSSRPYERSPIRP